MIKTTANPGQLTIEQNLSEIIIQSKNVPVLASQFDIFDGTGIEKRLFSVDGAQAQILEEDATIAPSNLTFAEIKFIGKRVGDAFEVSQELQNDEAIGLKNHLKSLIGKRNLKTYTAQAFGYGNKDGSGLQFQSILDYNTQTADKLINGTKIQEFTGGATVANVDDAYGAFSQDNSGEAVWVVDSFATANSLIVDGKPILKKDNRNDKTGSIGTIYGIPVHVQDMNAKAKMVLMNPKAYAVMIASEVERTGEDVFKAKNTLAVSIFTDGKVVDPNAIKIIKE